MKECPQCHRSYADSLRFCPDDGVKLNQLGQAHLQASASETANEVRAIPPPPEPLRMRMTIVDHDDEGHRSRLIHGLVLDMSFQGLRIQTGTVETGELNIIRDDTIAFKNKLEIEVDLPDGVVKLTGFAAWYKPVGDSINWTAGVYIRSMSSADRRIYEAYLKWLIETQPQADARFSSQA